MDTTKLRQTIARIDPAGDDAVDALLEVADLLDALPPPAEAQAEPEEECPECGHLAWKHHWDGCSIYVNDEPCKCTLTRKDIEAQAEPEQGDKSMEETIARQAREIERLEAKCQQLWQDRYDALDARTTDGLSAAEWQSRTGEARRKQREAEEALAEVEKERDIFRQQAAEAHDECVYANGERDKAEAALVEANDRLLRYATVEAELDAHMARADGLSKQLAQVEHQRDTAQALKEGLERDFDAALAEVARKARREALEEAAALVATEGCCRHDDHVQDFCACAEKAEAIRALADEPEQAEGAPEVMPPPAGHGDGDRAAPSPSLREQVAALKQHEGWAHKMERNTALDEALALIAVHEAQDAHRDAELMRLRMTEFERIQAAHRDHPHCPRHGDPEPCTTCRAELAEAEIERLRGYRDRLAMALFAAHETTERIGKMARSLMDTATDALTVCEDDGALAEAARLRCSLDHMRQALGEQEEGEEEKE
uniref:Uncharacterized protein n=1 Tax=viral metagenome TaxID=1070528 RepID=A0A6M3KA61_9ZZZZ